MTRFKMIAGIALIIIFWSGNALAQTELQNGWDAININDLEKARVELKKALQNSDQKEDALLSLSILNTIDKEDETAFNYFKDFFNLCNDPNPYLYAMWYDKNVISSDSKLSKARIAFFTSLLENEKISSTIKAKINYTLGYDLKSRGKFDKSDEYFARVGALMNWQLTGNFENISGSGFNKNWEAIAHPQADYKFINRNGAPVYWFNALNYRPGRWIHPAYHSYTENSIMFAQTFISSPKEQEVQLRLGVSGSVKLWVNDKLMFSEEDERNNGIDAYVFTAKLKSGYNRVLIQLGQSDVVDDMNYLLRITDKDGKLVEGLESKAAYHDYDKETSFTSQIIPNFSETYFEKRLKKDESSILSYVLLSKAYLSNDKGYETRKTLLKAQELAPKSSYLSNLLMDVYMRDDANTLLSLELEKVKKEDKKNPLSLQLLYNEAMEEKDYAKASSIVDQIENIFGKNEDVYAKKIDILSIKEEQKDMIGMMQEAYSKFPDNWQFVNYKYLIAVKINNNIRDGLSILNKFVRNNYNTSAIEAIAGIYASQGNMPKALSYYKEMENNQEFLPGYTNTIAKTYANQGNYKNAIIYYQKLLKKAPYVAYYMGELAKAYKENNENDKAKEYFEKALFYDPTDFDIRKIYREYTNKKAIFDYFEKPDLYKLFDNSQTAEEYPEDNSLIIRYENQKVVYHNGGSEEKIYLLIKAFNPTGIDQWKEYNISRNAEIEKAEVLKANGSRLKAETNEGHIVFTNLEENDAILLIYTVKYANSGTLLKHFWDDFYFDYRFPYNNITYSLLVQDELPFTYKMNNSNIKPEITKMDVEFTKYTWKKENVASVRIEKYMPAFSDFAASLHLSTIPDWNWVNEWYYDIYITKAKSDFEVQEVTHKLLNDKDNLRDIDKIHLIYDYVVKNIHYSSIPFRQNGVVPQKASKVINTKIGDCKDVSTLFVAMCREAGFKAEIVLVNTRDNGQQELFLPNIGFNHAIAKVYVDDAYYIVELTSDLNAFSTMGSSLKGAFVLEINDEKSEPYLLDSKTRVANAFSRETIVNINGDNINITRNVIRYGDYASASRNTFRDIGDIKRKQTLQRSISDDYAHIQLNSIHFDTTLYTTDDSLTYTYNFDVNDAFIQFGTTKLIELPFTLKQGPMDFINNPDRKYNINFWEFTNDDYQLEKLIINIPSNLSLAEMPVNMNYSSPYADYSLTFNKTGNQLVAIRKMVFKKDIVPVSDFATFSDFYAKVIKSDKTQIGFKTK